MKTKHARKRSFDGLRACPYTAKYISTTRIHPPGVGGLTVRFFAKIRLVHLTWHHDDLLDGDSHPISVLRISG
jgi:hypothetical protein